jgi:hypothetical protein
MTHHLFWLASHRLIATGKSLNKKGKKGSMAYLLALGA